MTNASTAVTTGAGTKASSSLRWWGFLGLALSILVQVLLSMKETPPEYSDLEASPEFDRALRSIILGGDGDDDDDDIDIDIDIDFEFPYNLVELKNTPSGTGTFLKILTWLVTRSLVSPFLLRRNINKNGVGLIRKLSSTKDYVRSLPVTHHPFHHASDEQMEASTEWNAVYSSRPNGDENGLKLYESKFVQQRTEQNTKEGQGSGGFRTVVDYYKVYSSGNATPTQVMERWINGATKHLGHLNIFSAMEPDLILEQARESDRRWKAGAPLSIWDGVPVAIKDCSSVKGLRMCEGSSVCTDPEKEEDDIPSEYLKQAGAIVVGLTVMNEAGTTPLGYNAHFNGPFNAYDTDYYSGGSSSGSAVAVAAGLVPMAIGWDGGGSIRIPAAMSGMVGLAPTFGRVPFTQNRGSSNVKAGPIGATMADAALAYMLLGQVYGRSDASKASKQRRSTKRKGQRSFDHDVFYSNLFGEKYMPDPHLGGYVSETTAESSSKPLEGTRLGVFWDHFKHTDPEVYETCRKVVRYLEDDLGATIVDITVPFQRQIHLSHAVKILAEFGRGWETPYYDPSHKLLPNTQISIGLGRTLTAGEVMAAENVRTFAIRYYREHLFGTKKLDAILSPTIGVSVPKLPPGYREVGETNVALTYNIMRFASTANFLGLPGLSIPVGYEKGTGLPIGFQFMGDAWSEATLLRLGRLVEEGFGLKRRIPPEQNFFDVLAPWMAAQE